MLTPSSRRRPWRAALAANLLVGAAVIGTPGASAHAAASPSVVRGTLIEEHGDTLQGREVGRSFILATAHGRLRLADQQPSSLDGQQVTVTDASTGRPGIQGQARAAQPSQHLQASPPPGPQTVLVLILTTPDDRTPAVADVATARAQIFSDPNSTAAYYAQQSNGTTTLVGRVNQGGDVIGPIALSTSLAGCPTDAIATDANQQASALGYTPSAYDHVIYLMPDTAQCTFGGLGDLPGQRVWSNGSTGSRILSHELGHNMGAHHASFDSCVTPTGAATPYSATCTSDEYGDPFDDMGISGTLMGAFHRFQIGELPAGEVVSLHQSGVVPVVSSDDFAPIGTRLVLVPIKTAHQPVHDYFALDTRSELAPFNSWSAGDPVTTGLTIRKVSDSTTPVLQTQLLDMNPAASPSLLSETAPLQPGQTFTDAADNISITAGTSAAGDLQATVSMPTLVDDVPPTPPGQLTWSGNSTNVHLTWTAGTDDVAVDHYQLTRDGTPLGTAAALSFDDPNVQSLAQITYGVSSVDTSGNVSTPATVVATPPDVTPPTPPLGLQAQRNANGSVTLTWTAGTDNRGVAGYRVAADGSTVTYAQGTTAQVSADARAHSYAVYTRDAAGNESAPAIVGLAAAPTPPLAPVTPVTPPGPSPLSGPPVAPMPGPNQNAAPTIPPPVLTAVREAASTWRLGGRAARRTGRPRLGVGTTFGFTLNVPAVVTVVFTRVGTGRAVAGRCVLPTARNGRAARCALHLASGAITAHAHTGPNTLAFQGRVSPTTRLAPGGYTALIKAATNGGRATSRPLSFVVAA